MTPSVPAGIVLVSTLLMMFFSPSELFGFLQARNQLALLYGVPVEDGRRFSSLVLDGRGNPGQDEVSSAYFMESFLSTRGASGGGGV